MVSVKQKTALIAIGLNTILTSLKFIAFAFTGSIAILAEAWHSFGDIASSIIVLASLAEVKQRQNGKWSKLLNSLNLEIYVSMFIGVVLLIVSAVVFKSVIFYTASPISNSLVSGIAFVLFACASYLVSRVEYSVGTRENSSALIADSLHSKADMLASLLTGFSLIIYNLGVNIDRYVACIIALLIFSISIEILVNNIVVYVSREACSLAVPFSVHRYSFLQIFVAVFELNTWIRTLTYINSKFRLNLARPGFLKILFRLVCAATIVALLAVLRYTCMITLTPYEEGIIERFGRPLQGQTSLRPGLHLKMPWPVDRLLSVDTRSIRQMNIGNIVDQNKFVLLWTKEHGTEEAFVSGDNYYFYPYLVLHYRINNLFNFIYHHNEPETVLNSIAHMVISHVCAQKPFYEIVTSYRRQLAVDSQILIQKKADELKLGIEIEAVNIKDIHPPIRLASYFEDVIASLQKKEKIINYAYGYRNAIIPKARGEAMKIEQTALSYAVRTENAALGESRRFSLRLEAFTKAKGITKRALYYDMVKEALAGNRKILVDASSRMVELWMDFDSITKGE